MGVKKQKQVRRHVRFYKACCGFREPFKVLCDGNFVHAVLTARIGSLHDTLPSLLGGGAKAFVTRCVIAELKKLGEDFSGTVLAARRLDIAKCDHDPPLPALDCMESMAGTSNPEHFFVATQDVELRRKLRKVPGGAIIFLQNTALILEQPSAMQLSYARLSEAERAHMANREEKVLQQRAIQRVGDGHSEPLDSLGVDDEGQGMLKTPEGKVVRSLKHKRAKGPNPLSQKKKQKKSTGGKLQQALHKDETEREGSTHKKRKRHQGHHKNQK